MNNDNRSVVVNDAVKEYRDLKTQYEGRRDSWDNWILVILLIVDLGTAIIAALSGIINITGTSIVSQVLNGIVILIAGICVFLSRALQGSTFLATREGIEKTAKVASEAFKELEGFQMAALKEDNTVDEKEFKKFIELKKKLDKDIEDAKKTIKVGN